MATKRKVVKKNIKRDPLVTYAVKASGYAQAHFNQIVVGVVILVGVIAVLVFTANSRQSAAKQARQQLSTGMALYQQQDYEAAKTTFDQIYQRHKGSNKLVAKYFKAECELGQRNFSQALVDFNLYLDNVSDYPAFNAAAQYGKALSQEGLEDYSAAAATMETLHQSLHEDDPRYLDAAFQAGEFFAKAGNKEEARKYFDQVKASGEGEMRNRATIHAALLEN